MTIKSFSKFSLLSSAALLVAAFTVTGCQQISHLSNDDGRTVSSSKSRSTDSSGDRAAQERALRSQFAGFEDVPVPPNSRMDIDRSLIFGRGNSWTGRIVQSTSLSIADAYDFYLENMPAYGWQEITVVRSDISVMTYYRSNRIATISLQPLNLGGTEVQFTISPRDAGKAKPPVSKSGSLPSDPR